MSKNITIKDLLAKKEQFKNKKQSTETLFIESLNANIIIKEPTREFCYEALEMAQESPDKADLHNVYHCVVEPNLKDPELQKEFGCVEPTDIVDMIFKAGEVHNIKPIGLGARDTLRLEMGYCLYGNDITDETSPIAAGLGWVTKFTKDFINAEALKAEKERGTAQKLVAFKMIDRGIPRGHYVVFDNDDHEIGEVTSGSMSPSLGYGIGLAYVNKPFHTSGTEIYIGVRNKRLKAAVEKLPLYKS